MAREWDVVVIGSGLAGRVAALAASDAGASVHVVGEHEDALRHSSGLLTVLGYDPETGTPIADPFDALGGLPEDHPYSILGVDAIRSSIERFSASLGGAFRGVDTGRNALVVGPLGVPIPAFGYPPAVEAGVLAPGDSILLVDVEPLPDFDASMAARNLRRAEFPITVDHGTIDLSGVVSPNANRSDVARRLDAEVAGEPGHRTVLPALSDELSDVVADHDGVGIPAMLGIEQAPAVREMVGAATVTPPFEIPTGPPSVLGIRLDRALDEVVRESNAVVTQGPRVVDFRSEGDRIMAVAVDRQGTIEWVQGNAFVLATGGFVGGGLSVEEGDVVESLFDIPVDAPDDTERLTSPTPFDPQPFARVGIDVDEHLRPIGSRGGPAYENLRAAGDVLGGFDPVAEGSGTGVPIVTGHVAGRAAATEGRV